MNADHPDFDEVKKSKRLLIYKIIVILIIVAMLIGLLLGLIFGLIIPYSQSTKNQSNEVCEFSHESYDHKESVLRKYKRFAVAADNSHCSKVGGDILRANGSVVDAAIATGLCNGIAHCQSSGIGGGNFMVIYLKSKNMSYAIDAREEAPENADKYMFLNYSSLQGGLATGIPGEISGYWEAYKLGGKLPWKTLFQPAINMTRYGFKISNPLAKAIRIREKSIRNNAGLSEIFINAGTNEILKENDTAINIKLADTLEMISENDVDTFYNGTLTKFIVNEINENGGNVTAKDFNDYKAIVKVPIKVEINDDFKLLTQPPPSSGILVSFIIRVMDKFNLNSKSLSDTGNSTLFYHRLIETFKHTYYQRSLLGDDNIENMTSIEQNLLDEKFVNEIRSKIVDYKTFPSSYYGDSSGRNSHGTTHITIVSGDDAVSLTSTINTYFGAKYVGKTTGILYNNQMDDFSTPDLINYFGLRPSEANYIKPGKRPMSSMSPTIILDKDNNIRLVIGASGGSRIISSVAQVAIENLWINSNIKDNIDAKRIHHQLYPEYAETEFGFDENIRSNLKAIGHTLKCREASSIIQAVSKFQDEHIEANCDGRKGGDPDGL